MSSHQDEVLALLIAYNSQIKSTVKKLSEGNNKKEQLELMKQQLKIKLITSNKKDFDLVNKDLQLLNLDMFAVNSEISTALKLLEELQKEYETKIDHFQ
ncbi:unnamed protein product [Rotaria magnacalcarata]|uniref:Uncharacterized protein n=1 Tax=Rotaria magnacalcarata TaxID=392030 RepID=A0A819UIN6_9BILA|nr:unnamed protein product [Rotaria magnacalcarata]CAF2065717.1 unnamed protein product [Rotaria magnacalcarata]CAF4052042.1 unnamed protein product [Rotaria magnacalcarata]CAF4103779.1 unnamed protein product [Rotaria magnacalcarata]